MQTLENKGFLTRVVELGISLAIVRVAHKNFIAKRNTFFRHDKTNADLLAIATGVEFFFETILATCSSEGLS